MGLFRKSPEQIRARQDNAIAEFWSWWETDGHDYAAALFDNADRDPGALQSFGRDLGRLIDPLGLAFETGAGRVARHVLVVTAAGDPDLRPVADRWLAAAPAPDDAFEYAAYRQPVADPSGMQLAYDGVTFDIDDMSVVAEVDGHTVHVAVAHPGFASAPQEVQGQVTFLFLDALLGEEAVETSVGAISWSGTPSPSAVPVLELPAIVAAARTAP
jgi:hypothetical protein